MNRPVSFCTFWLLIKLSFPKHVTELSLHLQAQHCSYNFVCCQTKDNLYLSMAVLLPKQRNPLGKQTKPNKIIRLALLQTKQKGLLSPDFCFTHKQTILVCPSSSGCNQGKNFLSNQWKTGLPGARVCSCFTENPKTQKLKMLTFSPLPKFAFYFLYLFSF